MSSSLLAVFIEPEIVSDNLRIILLLCKLIVLNLLVVPFWIISKKQIFVELNQKHQAMFNLGTYLLKEENETNPFFNFFLNKNNFSIRIQSKPLNITEFNPMKKCLNFASDITFFEKSKIKKELLKNNEDEVGKKEADTKIQELLHPFVIKEYQEKSIFKYVFMVNMFFESDSILYRSFIPREGFLLYGLIDNFNSAIKKEADYKLMKEYVLPGLLSVYSYVLFAQDDFFSSSKCLIIENILFILLGTIFVSFRKYTQKILEKFTNDLNGKIIHKANQFVYKFNSSILIFGLTKYGSSFDKSLLNKKISIILNNENDSCYDCGFEN